ncbi:hypothetical protein P4V64_19470 [Bacillus thuringiensis]|nr:hypothetical protein [Bacillus thuringiensis]
MSKIEQARHHMGKAQSIRGGTATFLLQTKDAVTPQVSAASTDPNLSTEGRFQKAQEIRDRYGLDFLQRAYRRKQAFLHHSRKAYEFADAVIYEELTKPDDEKLRRFEGELRNIKTEIRLAANPQRAVQKLKEFVEKLDDSYIANMVRNDFSEFITLIGSGDAEKRDLSSIYRNLTQQFETEEIREARDIMEAAKAAETANLFVGFIAQAAQDVLGDVGKLVNQPEKFFEEFPDLMKGDYVEGEEVDIAPQKIEYQPVVVHRQAVLPQGVLDAIQKPRSSSPRTLR